MKEYVRLKNDSSLTFIFGDCISMKLLFSSVQCVKKPGRYNAKAHIPFYFIVVLGPIKNYDFSDKKSVNVMAIFVRCTILW